MRTHIFNKPIKCFTEANVSTFIYVQICSDELSVTTGWAVLKFEDTFDMDMKLCKRVSKFKMLDSKARECLIIFN